MAPIISALSPKEEENVKEVLGMRCRAACRPYLQGKIALLIKLTQISPSVQLDGRYPWHGHAGRRERE